MRDIFTVKSWLSRLRRRGCHVGKRERERRIEKPDDDQKNGTRSPTSISASGAAIDHRRAPASCDKSIRGEPYHLAEGTEQRRALYNGDYPPHTRVQRRERTGTPEEPTNEEGHVSKNGARRCRVGEERGPPRHLVVSLSEQPARLPGRSSPRSPSPGSSTQFQFCEAHERLLLPHACGSGGGEEHRGRPRLRGALRAEVPATGRSSLPPAVRAKLKGKAYFHRHPLFDPWQSLGEHRRRAPRQPG